MNLIKNLEETSITTVQRRRRSHHTEEVSIKTDGNPTISPKPPTPTRPKRLSPTVTPKPTPTPVTPKTPPISTPRRDLIRKGTSVYAMWFDDDSLVYEVCIKNQNPCKIYIHSILIYFRVLFYQNQMIQIFMKFNEMIYRILKV